ncbi:sec-independent protein translocase protein TatA [Catalinimonas alkaloidigena]|uniref:twin-arginine translocase TatA/TatE family subunit n=1 Tax=Catalinimonas alkaloidigena TaxID=1075417 RepID=UPI002406F965|nr:twin-arginine translocase TatA/TatE family subunit [Catalinimonas alkaloidigena]MDF9800980.1 sec-independent protein translocase protein TatA [Catalinimonas alkaloidigena]
MESLLLFIGGLGGWEIFLILAIIMIFFGAKKIPQMAKGLGQGIKEYKSAISGEAERELKDS